MQPSRSKGVFAPWDDPGAQPLIRLDHVSKRFGEFTAIEDLSLDIFEGEFFALLGPSGCGKTTIMRMLAGFEAVSGGRILLDGRDMAGVPPNRRAVNMMFQSYALFPHLSVYDNIAFGLRRGRMEKSAIEARVAEMLRLTRLEKFAARKPHQISGGQRQRVALARSLAKAPRLLLLDEPLGALDKKLRQETQLELMHIQEETGTTFVIVTHDQEEAMTVASRVAVMDEGRIEQVATPARIYEEPASVYVAGFIGEVNILPGRATPEGAHLRLDWAEGAAPLVAEPPAEGGPIAPGTACNLAIRPEKIALTPVRPEAADNALEGTIEDVAYLGSVSTYHVRLDSGQMLKAQQTNSSRRPAADHAPGARVWLSWPAGAGVVLRG